MSSRPFATILGCSDSRVPPELLFDATFGELFVIRVAGNTLAPEVAASLQYAGVHLQTPLFVVLGHEACGAVNAALDTVVHGVRHHSRIAKLVKNMPRCSTASTSPSPQSPASPGRPGQRPPHHDPHPQLARRQGTHQRRSC